MADCYYFTGSEPWLSQTAELSAPQFLGYMGFHTTESMFALRWKTSDGRTFQAWLRLGERVDEYKLAGFDSKVEILSVEDHLGRITQLTLPEGKVRREELTDQEFSDLFKYRMEGADWTNAPILSREKAREFFLRMIRRAMGTVADVAVVFDVEGSTLPPEQHAGWAQSKVNARAAGFLLLAVVIDGKTGTHNFPVRPYRLPEQMTRNLLESDWDEIALLDATLVFKRRIGRER